jgi:hypothetical protein
MMIAGPKDDAPAEQGKKKAGGKGKPPVEFRFQPGQSGNPAGRPKNAGSSVREWVNQLAEMPLAEVRKVAESETEAPTKIMAAKQIIDACSNATLESGMPIRGQAFDRICDRTDGKPKQSIDHTSDGKPMLAAVLNDPESIELAHRLAERFPQDAGRNS